MKLNWDETEQLKRIKIALSGLSNIDLTTFKKEECVGDAGKNLLEGINNAEQILREILKTTTDEEITHKGKLMQKDLQFYKKIINELR